MTFQPVASAISKVKVMPAYLFNGVPSPDVIKVYHIFDVDGSITIRDEHYEEFGYELKINPLDYGFTGTVELYEDVEAETVMVSYKFKYKGKTYEVQVQFFFAKTPIKVKIKGSLPKSGTIRLPFKTAKAKAVDFVRRRFWSGIVENGEVLWGVGFDWSDITASWSFDADSLSFSVGTSFELDPATICTTTTSTATSEPYQRLSFYANGRHWVFTVVDGSLYWYHSVDGLTWTQGSYIATISFGRNFSVFFDGTYVHIAYSSESYYGIIYYRRGIPNSDGTITWSTPGVQNAIYGGAYSSTEEKVTGLYLRGILLTGNIYQLRTDSGAGENYDTYAAVGGYASGAKWIFNPYTSAFYIGGGAWPTTIGSNGVPKGWEYGNKFWCLDGRFQATLKVRNPTTQVFSGYVYAKLWVSDNSDMSGATALTGWVSSSLVSFNGTANQTVTVTINLDVDNPVGDAFAFKDKYFFIEIGWQNNVTAPTGAQVQLEATYTSNIAIPNDIPYYPTIAVDGNGYPWISFRRYNGINYYFYVAKGDANDGTFTFKFSTVRKLSTSIIAARSGSFPVPLSNGKMLVLYCTGSSAPFSINSQYWDGSSWGSEVSAGASLALSYGFSVIAINDTVELVYLEATSYDIEHRRWTSTGGWVGVATVQSGATSTSAPVLAKNGSNLYCFWAGSPTADHVYYKKYDGANWDINPTDWIDESTDHLTGNDRLSCFYKAYGNVIGLAYMTKTASPYNVRYAFLSLVVAVPKMVGDGLTWVVA
jgi:hypothetical protein